MTPTLLTTSHLSRSYRRGNSEVHALDDVTITVEPGEFLAIVGSSGSGKTTLLNLLAGLDTPTSGTVELNNVPLTALTRRQLSAYRAKNIGMIFQSFNLIAHYTALQNVEMALYFNTTPPYERRQQARAMLERLGLGDRLDHRPADLSGGEQQRVAVARAIVKQPEILVADEPTGNLDFENSEQIASILKSLNRDGLTIIMVTHNTAMAQEAAHRIVTMRYGRIVDDTATAKMGGAPA